MKKRILFVMHYLEIGGAETALIGLLNAIDYSRYDVDLFLHSHRGEMMAFIPHEVNLLPENPLYAQIERPMKAVLRDGYLRIVIARLLAKIKTKRYLLTHKAFESAAGLQYTADSVTPILPDINAGVEYDLAVSFLCPHNIVRDKVRAKKKVCWIHTDYSVIAINANQELPVWSAFDNIVSISEDVTKTFKQVFPSLEQKIVKIENILSPLFVRKRADEFDAFADLSHFNDGAQDAVLLLTIGRFSPPKNLVNVPCICRRIIEILGKPVFWFIIGYGSEEELIRRRIAECEMERNVIILGKKNNPYPYIKACDIYVQPSLYEGKSVTVREAQILCKPVIVTNYPTAPSQINHGKDGLIVPMDNEKCAEGIVKLIQDKELQKDLVYYLHEHDFGNESAVNDFYSIL